MTTTQKIKLAERLPFSLLVFASFMYLCSDFYIYNVLYDYLDQIVNCCLTFCFFAYLVSSDWNLVAKRSIIGLVLLNLLDLVYTHLEINFYFHLYKLIIIYVMSFIFIIDFYAIKNSKSI